MDIYTTHSQIHPTLDVYLHNSPTDPSYIRCIFTQLTHSSILHMIAIYTTAKSWTKLMTYIDYKDIQFLD